MSLIHEKIGAILAESESIAKDRTNTQQGFKFRGIDDVYNSIHPLLAKHGVFTTTQVLAERSEERINKNGGVLIYRILTIKFTFYAADGSHVESVIIGEGMDSGDKAANKALAIAHKYAFLQLLAIPTEDPKDPDAESHEVKPLSSQNPIGKPPVDALKQRAHDLKDYLAIADDVYIGILCAHGAKTVVVDGKTRVNSANCDYGAVINDLQERRKITEAKP